MEVWYVCMANRKTISGRTCVHTQYTLTSCDGHVHTRSILAYAVRVTFNLKSREMKIEPLRLSMYRLVVSRLAPRTRGGDTGRVTPLLARDLVHFGHSARCKFSPCEPPRGQWESNFEGTRPWLVDC